MPVTEIPLHEKLQAARRLFPSSPPHVHEHHAHNSLWLRCANGELLPEFMAMARTAPQPSRKVVVAEVQVHCNREMIIRWTQPETLVTGIEEHAMTRARKIAVTWENRLGRLAKFFGKLARMEERAPHVLLLSLKNDGRTSRRNFEDGVVMLRRKTAPSLL